MILAENHALENVEDVENLPCVKDSQLSHMIQVLRILMVLPVTGQLMLIVQLNVMFVNLSMNVVMLMIVKSVMMDSVLVTSSVNILGLVHQELIQKVSVILTLS